MSLPTPRIKILSDNTFAGHAVHFSAADSDSGLGDGIAGLRRCSYEWYFGDNSSHAHLNGITTSHEFFNPGTFGVTLLMTNEQGQKDSVRTVVTITNTTRKAYYVSPQGSDANDGTAPDKPFKTLAKITKLIGDNTAFYLQAGGTYPVNGTIAVNGKNISFDRYGSGLDPFIIQQPGKGNIFSLFNVDGVRFVHLTFDSDVQPSQINPKLNVGGIFCRGKNITIRDCKFRNIDNAVDGSGSPQNVTVMDCSSPLDTGLRGYFVWVAGINYNITGCLVINSTREHVVRSSDNDAKNVAVTKCHFANLDRTKMDAGDQVKTTINIRAGSNVWIEDCNLFTGSVGFGPTSAMASEMTANNITIRDCQIKDTSIGLTAGVHGVRIEANTFDHGGSEQIGINPVSADHPTRSMDGVEIVNNKSTTDESKIKFVKTYSKANAHAIKIQMNQIIASNATAADGSIAVDIHAGGQITPRQAGVDIGVNEWAGLSVVVS